MYVYIHIYMYVCIYRQAIYTRVHIKTVAGIMVYRLAAVHDAARAREP